MMLCQVGCSRSMTVIERIDILLIVYVLILSLWMSVSRHTGEAKLELGQ